MTTPEATPELELASAYLDGDVTAGERARVDGSPEMLASVASLRHNATLVAAVPPPTAAARESAIAAALAEFDSLQSSNVLSLAGRRWPTRVLTAAAAVVLLAVVGVSVLRNTDDNKSESASLATDTSSETAKQAGTEDAVAGAQPATANDDVVLAAAVAAIEINDPQDLLTLTAPGTPGADTSPVADTTAVAGETSPSPTGFESYNVDALACMSDTQEFLADIYYRGMVAIAVRDTVTGVTEAIDSNCTVLARVNP